MNGSGLSTVIKVAATLIITIPAQVAVSLLNTRRQKRAFSMATSLTGVTITPFWRYRPDLAFRLIVIAFLSTIAGEAAAISVAIGFAFFSSRMFISASCVLAVLLVGVSWLQGWITVREGRKAVKSGEEWLKTLQSNDQVVRCSFGNSSVSTVPASLVDTESDVPAKLALLAGNVGSIALLVGGLAGLTLGLLQLGARRFGAPSLVVHVGAGLLGASDLVMAVVVGAGLIRNYGQALASRALIQYVCRRDTPDLKLRSEHVFELVDLGPGQLYIKVIQFCHPVVPEQGENNSRGEVGTKKEEKVYRAMLRVCVMPLDEYCHVPAIERLKHCSSRWTVIVFKKSRLLDKWLSLRDLSQR